ncbi:MAG: S-layer homology domain-containing protein [Lachnospiraceae bacterium]|nr:S-layer homology domain-containing protein [Lachnospiraceae bacterium]
MKRLKKITAAALILLMVLASLAFSPGRAQAATYALIVGSNAYTASQASSDKSGSGWSWKASTKTLTLTDYNLGRIFYDGDLIVESYGYTNVRSNDTYDYNAIHANGDLTIRCHGDTEIYSTNGVPVWAEYGDVTIDVDFGRLCTIAAQTTGDYWSAAVRAQDGSAYLQGDGFINVKISSSSTSHVTNGIVANEVVIGKINSSDLLNLSVQANGSSDTYETNGIYVRRDVTLNGSTRLNVVTDNIGSGGGYGINQSETYNSFYLNGDGSHYIEGSTSAFYYGSYSTAVKGDNQYAYYQRGALNSKSVAFLTGRIDYLVVNGVTYEDSDLDTSFSDWGYSWDANTHILTLDEYYGTSIYASGPNGAMFVIELAYGSENMVYGRGYPALDCSCDVAIIGGGEFVISSDYAYAARTGDLYINMPAETLSIEGWNDSSYTSSGLYAADVIICNDTNVRVNIHADDTSNESVGIGCETIKLGIDDYDLSSLGITVIGDTTYDVMGLLLGNTKGITVKGGSSLSVNAYNFGSGGGYGMRSQATSCRHQFTGTTGLIKVYGSTKAFDGEFANAGYRPNQAKADTTRYYEHGIGELYALQIDGEDYYSYDLTSNISGSGWYWDANQRKLLLIDYSGGTIWASGPLLNLELASNSSNTVSNIYVGGGALRISGTGKLTVNNTQANYGIYAGGSIVAAGEATDITVKNTNSNTLEESNRGGIAGNGDIFILNGSSVKVNQNCSLKEFNIVTGVRTKGLLMVGMSDSDTANLSVISKIKGYYDAINIGIRNDYGTTIVLGKGLLSASISGAAVEEAALTSAMPIILDGSNGPIIFAGGTDTVFADWAMYGRKVWYNSAYTEKTPSFNTLVYTLDSKHYFELKTESTKTLTPSIGSASECTWSSSDTSVATVNKSGKVSALTYGYTIVRATLKSNPAIVEEWFVQTRYYDVASSSKYWFKPVYWAADNNITKGYDNVYFGPEEDCTRGQVMVFLWRLAGKPDVSSVTNPFVDVDKAKLGNTYYNAIMWGYEQGITKGWTISGKRYFKPNDPINRKDIMIMLYRYAGKPYWYFTAERPKSGFTFTDVIGTYEPGTDTYNAIAWGYTTGITNGYSGSSPYAGQFGCMLNCKRKDIVTFLYRMVQ